MSGQAVRTDGNIKMAKRVMQKSSKYWSALFTLFGHTCRFGAQTQTNRDTHIYIYIYIYISFLLCVYFKRYIYIFIHRYIYFYILRDFCSYIYLFIYLFVYLFIYLYIYRGSLEVKLLVIWTGRKRDMPYRHVQRSGR